MTSCFVVAVFALLSSRVATTGEMQNIDCMFVVCFHICFSSVSSVWKNLGNVRLMQTVSIYVLQGNKIFD